MRTIKRVIAGRQAKRRGEQFENIIYGEAYRKGWNVIRIPDGCKQISASKTIRVRTPFDFIFSKKHRVLFIDTKTTKTKTYSYSQITTHQVRQLNDLETNGFTAGYIINFSEMNVTVFYAAKDLKHMTPDSSLKPSDGILLGSNNIIDLDQISITNLNQSTATAI